jgi:hypothetical protein
MKKSYTHIVKGLDPVADAFDGTVYSDIVSLKNHGACEFVIYKGVGTTGTSTVTVQACDDVSASTTSAITFKYQAITSGDTHGEMTDATISGFTTTAGSSQLYRIYVNREQLAASGYEFVRLCCVESVNSPVLGGILVVLSESDIDTPVQSDSAIS